MSIKRANMAQGKPIKYSDIAVKKDIDQLKKDLDSLAAFMKKLRTELISTKKTLSSNPLKGGEDLKNFNVSLSKSVDTTEDLLRLQKNVNKTSKTYTSSLSALTAQKNKAIETDKKQAAAIEKGGIATAKRVGKESEYFKQLKKTAAEQKKSIELNLKETTSMNALSLALAKNRKKYRALSEAQRANSKIGGQLINTIRKQDTQIKKLDRSLGQSQRSVGKYSDALKGFGTQFLGITAIIYGFIRGIKDTFNRIREFDKEMATMAGIARTSKEELKDVQEEIIKVAGSSTRTSNEVAKLATSLFALGKTKEEIILMLKPVNDLSIALKSTSEDTAKLLGGMLNAFGEGADAADHYADVISSFRTSSALDFEGISDSMGYVSTTANVLGLSIGRTGAIISVLVDNQVKAARAGRLMNTSFARLATNGITLDEALQKIKDSNYDVKTASELFGKQSFSLAIILAKNTEKVDDLTNSYDNLSDGALKELTDTQMTSLDAKVKILDSTWEKFILHIDSGAGVFSRVFSNMIKKATDLVNIMDALSTGNYDSIVAWYYSGVWVDEEKTTKITKEEAEKRTAILKEQLAQYDAQLKEKIEAEKAFQGVSEITWDEFYSASSAKEKEHIDNIMKNMSDAEIELQKLAIKLEAMKPKDAGDNGTEPPKTVEQRDTTEIEAIQTLTGAKVEAAQTEVDLGVMVNEQMEKNDAFREKIHQSELDRMQLEKEAKIEALGQTGALFTGISEMMEEGSQEAKAFAIAGAIISTFATVANTIEGYSKLGQPWGGILGAIAGAGALVTGMARVRAIQNQPTPKAKKYAQGTEYLQRNGNPAGTDTIPIYANEGERIVPTEINKMMLGVPNAELPSLVAQGKSAQSGIFKMIARNTSETNRLLGGFKYMDKNGNLYDLIGNKQIFA